MHVSVVKGHHNAKAPRYAVINPPGRIRSNGRAVRVPGDIGDPCEGLGRPIEPPYLRKALSAVSGDKQNHELRLVLWRSSDPGAMPRLARRKFITTTSASQRAGGQWPALGVLRFRVMHFLFRPPPARKANGVRIDRDHACELPGPRLLNLMTVAPKSPGKVAATGPASKVENPTEYVFERGSDISRHPLAYVFHQATDKHKHASFILYRQIGEIRFVNAV